jgi:hypothetical protein
MSEFCAIWRRLQMHYLRWKPHDCFWQFSDKQTVTLKGRYWGNNGHSSALALNCYDAIDPERTFAVQCSNGFDVGFRPYQSTHLNRYDALSWARGAHEAAR